MARSLTLLVLAVTIVAGPVAAQEQSPVAALLAQGRNALNDLDYERAESVGRAILEIGPGATRAEQADACRLIAAAFYPEELGLQNADSALHYLTELIRLTPNADMPIEISWPGLDSLLDIAREHTFALWVNPSSDSLFAGAEAQALFDVEVSHESYVILQAIPEVGDAVQLDSAGPVVQATLQLLILNGNTPLLKSGRHELVITARAVNSSHTTSASFAADLTVPQLALTEVPSSLDRTQLLPEQTRPKRARNLLLGVGLGATTALLANTFRGSSPVGSLPFDSRAYAVGATISATTILMALLEKPAPLPENIAYNVQLMADFRRDALQIQSDNERRRNEFKALVLIGESRQ